MRKFLCLLFVLPATIIQAQQKSFTIENFFGLIKAYHPVAKQAALQVEAAKADVITARGAFDPVVQSDNTRKELDGLLYYDQSIHQLKIPTWFGLDIQVGLESLSGERTSAPDTKGPSTFTGFSMPVAKNLLLDKRRATLQQARLFQQASLQEQRVMINQLLLDGAKAYWEWWESYQSLQVFAQAIQNAEKRLQMVKTAYQLGERPAIDTLEAYTQWQTFRIEQKELEIKWYNAQQEVSVFLWDAQIKPYALPVDVIPVSAVQPPEPISLENILKQATSHPTLQQYAFKLNVLGIEKRLKFQSLLPTVYVKYNQLSKSHNLSKNVTTPWMQNNYRYGFSVAMPLRLSEGRGEYRKAKIKIQQTELEQWYKQISIETKIKQYYNEWQQLQQQTSLQEESIRLYNSLQRGEEQKFSNGESSLFLLNSRELKTIEARQKLISLQAKQGKSFYNLLEAAGMLN